MSLPAMIGKRSRFSMMVAAMLVAAACDRTSTKTLVTAEKAPTSATTSTSAPATWPPTKWTTRSIDALSRVDEVLGLRSGRVILLGYDATMFVPLAFDPTTGSTKKIALPSSHCWQRLVELADGRVLVAQCQDEPLVVYDPSTDRATTLEAHSLVSEASLVRLADGRVLFVGGKLGPECKDNPTDEISMFDPATATVSRRAPMKRHRRLPGLAPLPNGDLLVVGGTGCDSGGVASIETYDAKRDEWTLEAVDMRGGSPLTSPAVIATASGAAFVDTYGTAFVKSDASAWSKLDSMPSLRTGAGAAWRGGRIVVFGTNVQPSDAGARTFAFDPTTRAWGELPRSPVTEKSFSSNKSYAVVAGQRLVLVESISDPETVRAHVLD